MQLISNESKQIVHDLREALCIATKGHKKLFGWSVVLWIFWGMLRLAAPVAAAIVVTKIQDSFGATTLTGILIFWIIINSSLGNILNFFDFIFWDWMEPLRLFCHNHLFKQNFKNLLNTPPIVLENQQSSKIVSTINLPKSFLPSIRLIRLFL